MTLTDREKAMILISMRNYTAMEYARDNVVLLVDEGGGPWRQPMICGAVVYGVGFMARKWCRTLDELLEFLEPFELCQMKPEWRKYP